MGSGPFLATRNIAIDCYNNSRDKHASDDAEIGTVMDTGLKGLEAVLAIAHRGSFWAAALDLGMSTTALSYAIGRLEASLGVRLFNRTTRSVSLSDAGRDFVERVGPALAEIRGAMDSARSQRETPSGLLRIPGNAVAGVVVNSRIQRRKTLSATSRSRAACATVTPRSVTSLTASTLNSRLNFRLVISVLQFLGHDLIFVFTKPAAAQCEHWRKLLCHRSAAAGRGFWFDLRHRNPIC